MNELEKGLIQNARKLLISEEFQQLGIEMLNALSKENFDISPVFDYDTCLSIADAGDAEDYLSGGHYFKDIEFDEILSSAESIENAANENVEVWHHNNDTTSLLSDANEQHEKNKEANEFIVQHLELLLRLAFDASVEDAVHMNDKASFIFSECFK